MLYPPGRSVTSSNAVCRSPTMILAFLSSRKARRRLLPTPRRLRAELATLCSDPAPRLKRLAKTQNGLAPIRATKTRKTKDQRPKAQHHRGRRRRGTYEPGACLDPWAASSLPSRQEWHAHCLANCKAFGGGSAVDGAPDVDQGIDPFDDLQRQGRASVDRLRLCWEV